MEGDLHPDRFGEAGESGDILLEVRRLAQTFPQHELAVDQIEPRVGVVMQDRESLEIPFGGTPMPDRHRLRWSALRIATSSPASRSPSCRKNASRSGQAPACHKPRNRRTGGGERIALASVERSWASGFIHRCPGPA